MARQPSKGILAFGIIYAIIAFLFIALAVSAPIIVQSDFFLMFSYFRGVENGLALYIGLGTCLLTGILFIVASVLIFKARCGGHKLAFVLLMTFSVLGMYFLLPILIAHAIFFSKEKVKNQFIRC